MAKNTSHAKGKTLKTPTAILVEYVLNLISSANKNPKGIIIPYSDIENLLSIPYRHPCNHINARFSYYISEASKKLLNDHHIIMETITGYGLRIASVNDSCKLMHRFYNTGATYICKARTIGDSIDPKDLKNSSQATMDDFSKLMVKIAGVISAL